MKRIIAVIFFFIIFQVFCHATTWDEPWMDAVIKDADAFVKVDITENRPDGIKATLLKHLAGAKVPNDFEITGFSLLGFVSQSAKEDVFHFNPNKDYYLFIKRTEHEGEYYIATPTAG